MLLSTHSRCRTHYCASLLLLAMVSVPLHSAESVQSLRYGASLFHFYQQDYFEALSELMVGQAENGLGPHAEGAQLLRGGMSLSYGMDIEAEAIFNDQLAEAPENIDKSRAWFYLGKVAWQRGETPRAQAALNQMAEGGHGPLAEEASYLRASALLAQGEEARAMELLYALPKTSRWRYYLHYNAAAYAAAQGDWAAAQAHYTRFDDMPVESAEGLALQEKAQTAAGYAYLAADEPELARAAFETVSLNSAVAEKAMLGFGWAAVRQGNYADALRAWQPLTSRSMLEASARESLMAVPYAYEKLGYAGVALEQYQTASAIYAEQLADLEQAIIAFGEEPVAALLGLASGPADGGAAGQPTESSDNVMSWLFADDILPQGKYGAYLQFLVTRHSFQVALRELRDLYDMRRRLHGARERLAVLEEVDAHQQHMWARIVKDNSLAQLQAQASVLAREQQALSEQFDTASSSGNGRELATADIQARWARLERAEAAATALDRPLQREKLRFLRGLMLWEDSELFVAREWELRKAMTELRSLQQETRLRLAGVHTAMGRRSQASFLPHIDSLSQRASAHLQRVEEALAISEQGVRQLSVAALEEQAQQLRRALGQSGLAVARLYDGAVNSGGTP